MGEQGFHFDMGFAGRGVLTYGSESVANKPDEQGWQAHWAKCSTTVRLEPPHAPPLDLNSVERENFQG